MANFRWAYLLSLSLVLTNAVNISGCVTSKSARHSACERSLRFSWMNPGLLNGERIEKKFGSYGVQVLTQDELFGLRLSNLYSLKGQDKIMRTLALVKFTDTMAQELTDVHRQILDGAPIGATLKKAGFDITKKLLFEGEVGAMPAVINTMMHVNAHMFPAVIYELMAAKDGKQFDYCTITEIYSPDYVTMCELDLINIENAPPLAQDAEKKLIEQNLELIRVSLNQL